MLMIVNCKILQQINDICTQMKRKKNANCTQIVRKLYAKFPVTTNRSDYYLLNKKKVVRKKYAKQTQKIRRTNDQNI